MRSLLALAAFLFIVAWPKEGWVSGAIEAKGVSSCCRVLVMEDVYEYGVSPAPSAAEMDAQYLAWRTRLASVVPVVDRWAAEQARAGRLALVPVTPTTALVGEPGRKLSGGRLKRPALVSFPRCTVRSRNMCVVVGVALSELPPVAQRAELGASLCNALEAAADERPISMTYIEEQREDRGGLAMAQDGGFSVPSTQLAAVREARAARWQQASSVLQRSARRFEHDHPGVLLRKVQGLGVGAARFFLDAPFGGFDVLTEINAPAGTKRPTDVDVKTYFYEDWIKAGLPAETNIEALLGR